MAALCALGLGQMKRLSHARTVPASMPVSHMIPVGEVYSMDITPVIGAHIGPEAIDFAVVSKSSVGL
jgi:hypothetical protein